MWTAIMWDIARAGGFTSYILLTLSVATGLALSTQLQSSGKWPRLINNELHNFTTLLALIFTIIHVLAVWIDPFTNFGWSAVFIPFATTYHPVAMALGIVALYLGIAIGISTLIRPLIGYKWWRRFHVLTLVGYVLTTIHGIAIGSDTQTWWGLTIYATSILLVGGLFCIHLFKPLPSARKQPRPALPH